MVTKIDESLIVEIDKLELSGRLKQWKQASLDAVPRICTERAELAVESWRESANDNIEIRRAKLLKNILENIPVHIPEWQLLRWQRQQGLY